MKINRKPVVISIFVLGVLIFATSAFADIMLGSGYNSLKNSVKTTAEKLTHEADNFRLAYMLTIKVDGKTVDESTDNLKFDLINQAQESNGTYFVKGQRKESYYYNDPDKRIYKNFEDGSYNLVEKRKYNNERPFIENPFEEEQAKDAEKIMDAFVGSLKDLIQIEESDGNKMYMGNIGDSEIPPLVNAISSFALKYSILDEHTAERLNIPSPKSNVYFKDASGKAIENEDGILESGIFTANMSAEDSKGTEHIYTLEFTIDIKDINNTIVAAPDLDGQKVTYSKEGFEFDERYIGKYKNNIVKVEDNSFVKIGERIIEITSVEDGNVKGRYYEIYNEEYEPDIVRNFEFSSNHDDSEFYTILNYTNNNGEKNQAVLHRTNTHDLYISLNITFEEDCNGYTADNIDGFNSEFVRVFE